MLQVFRKFLANKKSKVGFVPRQFLGHIEDDFYDALTGGLQDFALDSFALAVLEGDVQ